MSNSVHPYCRVLADKIKSPIHQRMCGSLNSVFRPAYPITALIGGLPTCPFRHGDSPSFTRFLSRSALRCRRQYRRDPFNRARLHFTHWPAASWRSSHVDKSTNIVALLSSDIAFASHVDA